GLGVQPILLFLQFLDAPVQAAHLPFLRFARRSSSSTRLTRSSNSLPRSARSRIATAARAEAVSSVLRSPLRRTPRTPPVRPCSLNMACSRDCCLPLQNMALNSSSSASHLRRVRYDTPASWAASLIVWQESRATTACSLAPSPFGPPGTIATLPQW